MSSSGGGEPRTVDVPLAAPAPSVSYTLPPGVTFDVEAVYVEVTTAGAGGAVTAELTISEQSGVVIAKKTQGATIPAGSSGTATWALRLTDEGTSTPVGSGINFEVYPQSGAWLEVEATGAFPAAVYNDLLARFPGKGFGFWASIGTLLLAINGDTAIVAPDGTGSIDIIAFKSANAVLNMEAWEWFGDFSFVQLAADANMELAVSGAADLQLTRGGTGHLKFNNLPIVNPGGSGRVWNNGGVLSIT